MITIEENLLIIRDCMLAISVLITIIIGIKYKSLKETIKEKSESQKNININGNFKKDFLELTKYNSTIDVYLKNKLENLFNSFIFKGVLYTLRQYSNSISENEKVKLRAQFLEYLEFSLTENEKTVFMDRYVNFELFKYLVIDFFNVKLNKLELVVCHKLDIDEKEFKDIKLIKSLYDNFSQKELKNMVEILQEFNPEKQINKKDK